jgi:tetratricopeptide (TPR) repeat protein
LAAAQALYEQALAIDPTLATAHYNLGMALKEQGQLAPAIEHYQQAIVLQPDYAEAHQNLGVALLKAGSVVESLDSFGRAIGIYEQRGEGGDADRLRQGLQELGFTVHS